MLTEDEKIIFDKVIPFLAKYPVVFDVGAYKGGYTDYVLSKIPNAMCWLFEPNSELFDGLCNYHALNILLSDKEGVKPFYRCLNKADELSSIYNREVFGQVEYTKEEVPCTTIDNVCLQNSIPRIDFLKIDVEGAELDVLKGSENMLKEKKIHFLQVEYGGTYPDAGITFKELLSYVNSFGYSAFELKGKELSLLTVENFVEDYRFANFLITHHDIG